MLSLNIIHQEITETQDKIYHIQLPAAEMITFGYIIESLEGWAFHTLLNKEQSVMYVEVIKDHIPDFEKLLSKMTHPKPSRDKACLVSPNTPITYDKIRTNP